MAVAGASARGGPSAALVTPVRVEDVEPRVEFVGTESVADTRARVDGFIQDNGRALRYGIGVDRKGFTWSGKVQVSCKAERPDWRPPPEILQRQPICRASWPAGAGTLDTVKQRGTLQCGLNQVWSMGGVLDAPLLR